ncbi:dolichol kinase [Strigomonas culicis]|uniref:dolichol kinase n=1 Tax=Strigomonas culicis TaxID=28005 RepID=S9VPZ5_9TRYP|nr:dolichol kinase [Strigomonas culicis]|eukprot:EPY29126.1 dolichol kinase [Strigomonas culicis]
MYYAVSYQFREDAILWTVAYIGSSTFRTWTFILWGSLIPIAVVLVDVLTRRVKSTVRRKLFHFIGVISFTPVVMIDPIFFAFAISTATSVCLMVEVGRFFQVYGTSRLSAFLKHHIDERESTDGIIRTHMYLIFGMGASLILHYRHVQNSIREIPAIMELAYNLIPGVISLGVIDSAAAIVGSSFMLRYRKALGGYLKNKFFTGRANPSISHKTTTGTIGGFVAGLLFWILILKLAEVPLMSLPTMYSFLMIAAATLTECFMDGIDNLQLPLVMISATCHLFALLMGESQLWLNEEMRRPNPTTASSLASALRSAWRNFKVNV